MNSRIQRNIVLYRSCQVSEFNEKIKRYDGMQIVIVAIAKCMKLFSVGIYKSISIILKGMEAVRTLVMPKIEVT
jgi:hypothetical protein